MLKNSQYWLCVSALLCFGLVLRSGLSLHSFSGECKPPMFGDYEAQRHWQEVTLNLMVSDWYRNTTDNDLMYWGLDYPPLTAYHSWAVGKVANRLNPAFVALHKSRGISTPEHKNFMRQTVLMADVCIYLPALLLASKAIADMIGGRSLQRMESSTLHLAVLVAYPGQILIDNGHFQYNNLSLGLTVLAVVCIFRDKNIWSAVLFSLALNYKQMELYHAIPFFIVLLRKCFPPSKDVRTFKGLIELLKIGSAVIVTFLILWLPWLTSIDSFLQIVQRIFPLARGVFEDKVSNFWCILNVFVKIREIIPNEKIALLCLVTTLLSILPSSLHLFLHPTKRNFLYSLTNVSLSFFLFSFQVHEKSILLAAIPVTLLFPLEPVMSFCFLQVSTFSMFPLLSRDGLSVPTLALSIIFFAIMLIASKTEIVEDLRNILYFEAKKHDQTPYMKNDRNEFLRNLPSLIYYSSTTIAVTLAVMHLYVEPPTRFPDIFPLAISAFCCLQFIIYLSYFNYRQFTFKYNK